MAAFDPVFNGAGAAAGLECWRIENKKPVKFEGGASPAVTGKFHAGDSYLLLNTVDTKSGLRWDLHFWLGEESSQDEIGIAAYKVEARPATLLPTDPSHTPRRPWSWTTRSAGPRSSTARPRATSPTSSCLTTNRLAWNTSPEASSRALSRCASPPARSPSFAFSFSPLHDNKPRWSATCGGRASCT
jgi:hypothetical protein